MKTVVKKYNIFKFVDCNGLGVALNDDNIKQKVHLNSTCGARKIKGSRKKK